MKSMCRYAAAECLLLLLVASFDFMARTELSTACVPDFLVAIGSSVVIALLASSLVFLLGDFAWLVSFPVVAWCAACTLVEWFFRSYFYDTGLVGGAFVVRYLVMSWDSVFNFLSQNLLATVAGVVIFIAYLGVSFRLLLGMRVASASMRSIAIGAVLIAGLTGVMPLVCLHDHVGKMLFDHVFFGKVSSTTSYDLASAAKPITGDGWTTEDTNIVGVVVIGESSSSRHWSLYGYQRLTTPLIGDRREQLVVFGDVRICSCYTLDAVRDELTYRSSDGLISLPSVAIAAGYSCSFCSSQGTHDCIDNNIGELLFRNCFPRIYTRDTVGEKRMDNTLLQPVGECLDRSASNAVVFVQMLGSHTPWEEKFPESCARFPDDFVDDVVAGLDGRRRAQVNRYDNSIVFTDMVLAEMIGRLEGMKRKSFLVYFSDHGESPRTFMRDMSSEDLYAIPFFLWLSPEYRASYADRIERWRDQSDRPMNSTELFSILLDVMGVSKSATRPSNSCEEP